MIKITDPIVIEKGWGREIIFQNNEKYCGKILEFDDKTIELSKKTSFSMHFHMIKDETWFIQKGNFTLSWIDPSNAEQHEEKLIKGQSVHIPPGSLHRLTCESGSGKIYEVSTPHYNSDSYRVSPGDSQKK